MKTLLAKNVGQWSAWLNKHHKSGQEVWLIFYKRHTGIAFIDHKDAIDGALCFGWVDSLIRRLDDQRFAIKFTPRRPGNRWSAANRERYEALKAGGRLKPGGIERGPTDPGYAPRPQRPPLPAKLPPYIQAELKKHPVALRYFEALSQLQGRRYLNWIESAKRDDTKLRRLEEAIRLLTEDKMLGLK